MRTLLRPKQVGVFPCRGLVAPCQRATRSIEEDPLRVNGADASPAALSDPRRPALLTKGVRMQRITRMLRIGGGVTALGANLRTSA